MKIAVLLALALALGACASSEGGAEVTSAPDPTDQASSSTTNDTSEPPPASTTSITPPPSTGEAFVVRLDGGCMMMGPNCPVYLFSTDGTVDLVRLTEEEEPPLASASIDPALIAAVTDLVHVTDLDALAATLPAGECRGCYDGIDVTYLYFATDDPTITLAGHFASTEVELVSTEPLFAATEAALIAAQSALGDLPVVSR
jgi:hypothetical protein